jgi:hypothetical protein
MLVREFVYLLSNRIRCISPGFPHRCAVYRNLSPTVVRCVGASNNTLGECTSIDTNVEVRAVCEKGQECFAQFDMNAIVADRDRFFTVALFCVMTFIMLCAIIARRRGPSRRQTDLVAYT